MKIKLQGIEKDVIVCFARLFWHDIGRKLETQRIEDMVLSFIDSEKKRFENKRALKEKEMQKRFNRLDESESFFDFDMEFDRYRTNW